MAAKLDAASGMVPGTTTSTGAELRAVAASHGADSAHDDGGTGGADAQPTPLTHEQLSFADTIDLSALTADGHLMPSPTYGGSGGHGLVVSHVAGDSALHADVTWALVGDIAALPASEHHHQVSDLLTDYLGSDAHIHFGW